MNKNKRKTDRNPQKDTEDYFTTSKSRDSRHSSKRLSKKKKHKIKPDAEPSDPTEPTVSNENDLENNIHSQTDANWYQRNMQDEPNAPPPNDLNSEGEDDRPKKKKSRKGGVNRTIQSETLVNKLKKNGIPQKPFDIQSPPLKTQAYNQDEDEGFFEYAATNPNPVTKKKKIKQHEENLDDDQSQPPKEKEHEYNDSQKKHSKEKKANKNKMRAKSSIGPKKKSKVKYDYNPNDSEDNNENNEPQEEEKVHKKKKKKKNVEKNDEFLQTETNTQNQDEIPSKLPNGTIPDEDWNHFDSGNGMKKAIKSGKSFQNEQYDIPQSVQNDIQDEQNDNNNAIINNNGEEEGDLGIVKKEKKKKKKSGKSKSRAKSRAKTDDEYQAGDPEDELAPPKKKKKKKKRKKTQVTDDDEGQENIRNNITNYNNAEEENENQRETNIDDNDGLGSQKRIPTKIEKIDFVPEPAPDPEREEVKPTINNFDNSKNNQDSDDNNQMVNNNDNNDVNNNSDEDDLKPKKKKKKKKKKKNKVLTDDEREREDYNMNMNINENVTNDEAEDEEKPKKKKKKKKKKKTMDMNEDDDNFNLIDESPINPKQKRPKSRTKLVQNNNNNNDDNEDQEQNNDNLYDNSNSIKKERNDFLFPPEAKKTNKFGFENEDNDENINQNGNNYNDNNIADDEYSPKKPTQTKKIFNRPNDEPQDDEENEEQKNEENEYQAFESKMKKNKNNIFNQQKLSQDDQEQEQDQDDLKPKTQADDDQEQNQDNEEEQEQEEKKRKKKKKKKKSKKSKSSEDFNNEEEEDQQQKEQEEDDGKPQLIFSNVEKKQFEIEPGLIIECSWYYINKKPKKKKKKADSDSDDDDDDDTQASNKKKKAQEDEEEQVHMDIKALGTGNIILHWGIFKAMFGGAWSHPPKSSYPPNSKEIDQMAIQTPFPLMAGAGATATAMATATTASALASRLKPVVKAPIQTISKPRIISMTIPRGTGLKDYISGFKFVIFLPDKNVWFNNGGRDYVIEFNTNLENLSKYQVKLSSGYSVPFWVLDVINCEANLMMWTLMHRYNKCSDVINSLTTKKQDVVDNWIWICIWIRYSFIRQLDWQRCYNTTPRLLADAMNNLSNLLTKKYSEAITTEKPYRNLIDSKTSIIKNILAMLGKGTGNGQAIRDQILNVMHKNNIKECPTGNFYEQWHQKLHNNSTPDDVVICEAVIAFLKSGGDLEIYWKILEEGGVTKERLASYERKIIDEPYYNSNYCIQDFEDYLRTLKAVHASTDLIMTYEGCRQYIGDCTYQMDEIISNKDTDDIIKQLTRVAECREKLQTIMKSYLSDFQALREILFLELSLEIYVRQLVEKAIHIERELGDLLWEIDLILRNIKISFPNYKEFFLSCEDWFNIVEKLIRDQSRDASLKVYSGLSRMNRQLSLVIDYYNRFYDEKAKYFGNECKLDKGAIELFSEELIRGTIFFTLSMLIKKIEPSIRRNAQLGDWLIISRGKELSNFGKIMHVPNLREEQFAKYKDPRIILCENVAGDEEVPVGCSALLIIKSGSYPDTLSHISVRARNLGIPFGVCFNDQKSDMLLRYLNNYAEVKIVGQEVLVAPSSGQKSSKKIKSESTGKITLANSGNTYKKIFVELNEMDNTCVGAKSLNTKNVFGRVSGCSWLKYPESFSIPFNVFEYFLSLPENETKLQKITKYLKKINKNSKKETIRKLLNKCKQQTLSIQFVENKQTTLLKKRILQFGVRPNDFNSAFTAIKSVWASKFNERVYIAVSKVGVTIGEIKMSVLCQKIIPAEYAYVIHTKNPTNNNPDELFAEVVAGMGETLVGAYEGQSLSFAFNKRNGNYTILSYPNKNISLRNSGFIFRSDSNIEDLEGFSGAGLFDSVPMVEDQIVDMVYYKERLVMDSGFIDNMIKKISQLGISVEQMYRSPQDIEGVYYNGDFYIVQTRPQV